MESKLSRKEAINEFKARKVPQGVYAVRCTATGRAWVGSSRNLDATRTGLWFMLRNGSHINRALQAEWNSQGEETIQYEVLEKLDEDLSPMAASDLLKEKKRDWLGRLQAQAL